MITNWDERVIRECEFFEGKRIEIYPIYLDDPIHKCFLVRSDKNYKVRLSKKQYSRTVQAELDAIRLLEKHVEWTPTVYYSNVSNANRKLLVYEFIEGTSLDKIEISGQQFDSDSICKQLSRILNQIHQIPGDYFGEFDGTHFASWEHYLGFKFENHLNKSLELNLLDLYDLKLIESRISRHCDYFAQVTPTFLHFDVKPANIVLSDGGTVTLIDFELSRFGDPAMEYSKMLTDFGTTSNVKDKILGKLASDWFNNLSKEPINFSEIVMLYQLYNQLAYYTTSLLKHHTPRPKLIPLIKQQIQSIRDSENLFVHR
ncbi:MAG: aminoglycoside phosphotransferase family protein [Flavobacteriales bacterium]|nr:aminoglycoside phosphotransferase family protein [Flavobacteriales bacterium]